MLGAGPLKESLGDSLNRQVQALGRTLGQAKGEALFQEAEVFAATHRLRQWRALASVIFMNKRVRGEG